MSHFAGDGKYGILGSGDGERRSFVTEDALTGKARPVPTSFALRKVSFVRGGVECTATSTFSCHCCSSFTLFCALSYLLLYSSRSFSAIRCFPLSKSRSFSTAASSKVLSATFPQRQRRSPYFQQIRSRATLWADSVPRESPWTWIAAPCSRCFRSPFLTPTQ